MKSILILNADIVNEGAVQNGDIFVKSGRIEQIGGDLSKRTADVVIDAAGKFLLPGMIDDQVHFREPGLTHKGDIHSESRAAVAGGITSYMEMPNTLPPTISAVRVREKLNLAANHSLANYAFFLGATNENIEEIKAISQNEVCGIKAFLGSSTGNLLLDDSEAMERLFSNTPLPIAVHCEDPVAIRQNERLYRERIGESIPFSLHPKIRSAEACYASSSRAVEVARKYGTRLHILHISTAKELELFSSKPLREKNITAEACLHHLFFDESDYMEKGALIKCNPAIKTAHDREALQEAVRDGRIDVFGTDHAPHTLEEKRNPYFRAPSGLPLAQHAFPLLFDFYQRGIFSLPEITRKASHAPADLFHVRDRGYIREGYWADLVLVDPKAPFTVTRENLLYKCGWSPLEGHEFRSSVDTTIVSGHLAYYHGRLNEEQPGRRLEFDRNRN